MESPSPSLAPAAEADLVWLQTVAARLVASDDAADLVQETWIQAHRAGVGPQGPRRQWWAGILRNRGRMARRSDERRRARERAGDEERAPLDPDDALYKQQVVAALRQALHELESDERDLLWARYGQDKSAAELAADHGVVASTIRSRLHRATRRLEALMKRKVGADARVWAAALGVAVPPSGPAVPFGTGAAIGLLCVAVVAVVAPSSPVPERIAKTSKLEPWRDALAHSSPAGRSLERWPPDSRRRWRAKKAAIAQARAEDRGQDSGRVGEANFFDLFLPVSEELMDGVIACADDLEGAEPKSLSFVVHLAGEPDVGGIVERVELSSGSSLSEPEAAALVECAMESSYTVDFPAPPQSLVHVVSVDYDRESGIFQLGFPMDTQEAADVLVEFEELASQLEQDGVAGVEALVQEDPALADALRQAIESDPSLVERNPALAEAVRGT